MGKGQPFAQMPEIQVLLPAGLELAGSEAIAPDRWGTGVTPGGVCLGWLRTMQWHSMASRGCQRHQREAVGTCKGPRPWEVSLGSPCPQEEQVSLWCQGAAGQRTHP